MRVRNCTTWEGLYFRNFTGEDVVRHPLVQKIVEAYESAEHD